MKVVTDLPRDVREVEHFWIPLPDGCRLAARAWIPEDAAREPVPAILECVPYRKRDGTRWRDEPMHRWFAGHGLAAVRIDLRGTGESDGVLLDEYLPQERRDCADAIAWVAAQPWCSGSIGLMGKSWGGINALQVAALRPPALKAVLTACSTDDRWADDAHYMGGCLLNENLTWGSVLMTVSALPPDPVLYGDGWRRAWLERVEAVRLHPATWLRHQSRDAYWRDGSASEDPEAIACPVYAVGGWADAYTNAVPRLLETLRVPRRGLVGPWAHLYPHEGVPGPAIGFLQEALAWWRAWLGGQPLAPEPAYRVFMQDGAPARETVTERPGRWVAEDCWPSPRIRPRRYRLHRRRLAEDAEPQASEETLSVRTPQTVGTASGAWCSFGQPAEMPGDQREDDGKSLTFDSPPLPHRLEILGAPAVELHACFDRPRALLAVRLEDVAPDGSSTRVTYGLLNLAHREDPAAPAPVPVGRTIAVRMALNHVAHAFAPGHRLRLAISTTCWPLAWPAPEPVTLDLITGRSLLELPERPPRAGDAALRPFAAPEAAEPALSVDLDPQGTRRSVLVDLANNETITTIEQDVTGSGGVAMTRLPALGLDVGHSIVERFRIREDDPLSAVAEVEQRAVRRRGEWSVRVEVRTRQTATAEAFRVEGTLEAWEGDRLAARRAWDERIPRRHA